MIKLYTNKRKREDIAWIVFVDKFFDSKIKDFWPKAENLTKEKIFVIIYYRKKYKENSEWLLLLLF